jgi:hypothetical protein
MSNEFFEEIIKVAEHVAEHVGHHVAEHIQEHGLDFLDFDEDGSITDTIPDLAQGLIETISDWL